MKKRFLLPALLFLLFTAFTAAVAAVDVQPVGPEGSCVGLATLNSLARTAYSPSLYAVSEAVGLLSLLPAPCFALLGLLRLLRGKLDKRLLAMGGLYTLTALFYVLFECIPVNFRPILTDGALEASYPSSHTLLALCVCGSAALYLRKKPFLCSMLGLLAAGSVALRLLCGVHWLTDILGGILLSCTLLSLYAAADKCITGR